MPRVEVVAATYYDDRGIGGSEGVIIYYSNPATGERGNVEAPVDNWHSLAREASGADCYVKYGPNVVNVPPDEDSNEIFGDHDIAVHIKLPQPEELELLP